MNIRTLLLGFLLGILTTSISAYTFYPVISYGIVQHELNQYLQAHPDDASKYPVAAISDRCYPRQGDCLDD